MGAEPATFTSPGHAAYVRLFGDASWALASRGDGTFDRHSVFIDKLVLPRFVLPLDKGSILTMETNADDIFKYTDTNGDGVAEKKERFFSGAGRRGNLEHQQSGFVWGLDNWIYSTYNAFRFRWTPSGPTTPDVRAPATTRTRRRSGVVALESRTGITQE